MIRSPDSQTLPCEVSQSCTSNEVPVALNNERLGCIEHTDGQFSVKLCLEVNDDYARVG